MASISWDVDASDGGLTLASLRPDPGNRFFAYAPDVDIVGPVRQAIGDGTEYLFEFRGPDYFAHIEIHHLDASQLGLAQALQVWLLRRLPVDVTPDDNDANTYTGLKLKPGTKPTIRNDDDTLGRFTFACDLWSTDPILVNYGTPTT